MRADITKDLEVVKSVIYCIIITATFETVWILPES